VPRAELELKMDKRAKATLQIRWWESATDSLMSKDYDVEYIA